jgi:tartrate dehydratase alpha subunit/fumarate hydratase class I-like protein
LAGAIGLILVVVGVANAGAVNQRSEVGTGGAVGGDAEALGAGVRALVAFVASCLVVMAYACAHVGRIQLSKLTCIA